MDDGPDADLAFHATVLHRALDAQPGRLAAALADLRALSAAGSGAGRLADFVRTRLATLGFVPDWGAGERAATWLSTPERRVLLLGAPNYPRLLTAIPVPPPILFVEGRLPTLERTQLAIVGSRRATLSAREFAGEIAARLVEAGLAVTSGLARGVDGAAHAGALEAGGPTIAVLGCGIDRVYPRQHRALAAAVREAGALVSEFPLGTPPLPGHFPRRNRIISGLSFGTLVVEAALTSGSLVTARHALDQGREVFAVPGSIRNPLSRGTHALLRDGATLVEDVADILGTIPDFVAQTGVSRRRTDRNRDRPSAAEWTTAARAVCSACDFEPRGIDRIVEACGLTASEVSSILTTLEMQGVVRAVDGGAYVLTGTIPA